MHIGEKSLSERYKRVHKLEVVVQNAEADIKQKQNVKLRTKDQQTQLLAAKDRLIELPHGLDLDRRVLRKKANKPGSPGKRSATNFELID